MPVVSLGPFAVRLAGDASFPVEPPRLAREVDVTEPSESARTVRFAAVMDAVPPTDALVRCVTFARAIPAPPAAALASPLAEAATRFVAEIVRSPLAVTVVEPSMDAVAVLLMSAPATATSAPGVPSPGGATALIGAVTVDDAVTETPPVALSTDDPPTETVAVESACRPMNLELGEAGATVEIADIAMFAPLRCASVRVADADPVAFTSPLRAEPDWSLAAWRLIDPPGFVTTVPTPTVIFSAFTRNTTPENVSVPVSVTSSLPAPPSMVRDAVGTGNEMLSIVGAVASSLVVGLAGSGWRVMWSSPLLPVT